MDLAYHPLFWICVCRESNQTFPNVLAELTCQYICVLESTDHLTWMAYDYSNRLRCSQPLAKESLVVECLQPCSLPYLKCFDFSFFWCDEFVVASCHCIPCISHNLLNAFDKNSPPLSL